MFFELLTFSVSETVTSFSQCVAAAASHTLASHPVPSSDEGTLSCLLPECDAPGSPSALLCLAVSQKDVQKLGYKQKLALLELGKNEFHADLSV